MSKENLKEEIISLINRIKDEVQILCFNIDMLEMQMAEDIGKEAARNIKVMLERDINITVVYPTLQVVDELVLLSKLNEQGFDLEKIDLKLFKSLSNTIHKQNKKIDSIKRKQLNKYLKDT